MSFARDIFCFDILFTMIFAALLYVATGVVGCEWPISARSFWIDFVSWKFSNNPPNSDSVPDAMSFLIMLHYTCTGTFSVGIACIGGLDFGPGKNIHLLCFVPLVMICRLHANISEE